MLWLVRILKIIKDVILPVKKPKTAFVIKLDCGNVYFAPYYEFEQV